VIARGLGAASCALVLAASLALPVGPSSAVAVDDPGAEPVRASRVLSPPVRDLVPQDARVWVLGDSLTSGTLMYGDPRYLVAEMDRRDRELSPRPSTRVGRTVAEGMAVLDARTGLPDDVLIALGTNDWLASSTTAAGWIAKARRIVGPHRDLYWVNLAMTGSARDAGERRINSGLLSGVRADNATMRSQGRPGRSFLLEWNAFARDKGIPNTRDGIHYTVSGYAARARFMAGTLAGSTYYAPYVRT
jgi:hypothetical protein